MRWFRAPLECWGRDRSRGIDLFYFNADAAIEVGQPSTLTLKMTKSRKLAQAAKACHVDPKDLFTGTRRFAFDAQHRAFVRDTKPPRLLRENRLAPAVPPSAMVERLLQEAQDAYVHGHYAKAIEMAKKARPDRRASHIIGAASCFLKDRPGAMQAWNELSAADRSPSFGISTTARRKSLKYVCSRNDITIP